MNGSSALLEIKEVSLTFKNSRDPQKSLVVLRITPEKVEFVKRVEPE